MTGLDEKLKDTAKHRVAVIVGAGDFTPRGLDRPCDLVIAADGGLVPLTENRITPDVIIGDYDSLGYEPEGRQVITLQREKDDTDMEAALGLAWEKGCRQIRIYGGSGSRPDHFLGNLQLMAAYSRRGGILELVAPEFTVYAISGKDASDDRAVSQIRFHGEAGTVFSVFSAYGSARGVTIAGNVKYPMRQQELPDTTTLGVSNELTGPEATVSVGQGTLLILVYEPNRFQAV